MSGNSLNTASSLQCPHGGVVQIASGNTTTKAGGAPMVTAGDSYTISGCPFQLPGPTPSPCIEVQWLVPDTRVKVQGNAGLSASSSGICLNAAKTPQGPVSILNTQTKVSSQ